MNRVVLMSAAAALALSLGACDRSSAPAEANGAASATADADALEALDAEFLASIKAKDYDKSKTYYASDAVMVLPEMAPFKGTEPIGASFDDFAKDPAGSFAANNESVVVSSGGDLAYSQGTYTVSYTNSQTKQVENGQGYYLIVYKKQPDGSWKIVQDVSSPTPAAA